MAAPSISELRSPLSRLPSDPPGRIGHNLGPPLDPGQSWRRHAWTRARAELVPRLPLEVVRRRVARARALGLAYPDYAAILLGTGRDIVGFLFTCEAIGLRLARHGPDAVPLAELAEPVAGRLRGLTGCERLLIAPAGADAAALARALEAGPRIRFAAAGTAPAADAPLPEGRAALRALIGPLGLPPDGVVMVGTEPRERDWTAAARLARFLAASRYFGAQPGA